MRCVGLVSSMALVAVLIGGALLPAPAVSGRAASPRGVVVFTAPRRGDEVLFVLRADTGPTRQIAHPMGAQECCVTLFGGASSRVGGGGLGVDVAPGGYSKPLQPQWGAAMPSGTSESLGE